MSYRDNGLIHHYWKLVYINSGHFCVSHVPPWKGMVRVPKLEFRMYQQTKINSAYDCRLMGPWYKSQLRKYFFKNNYFSKTLKKNFFQQLILGVYFIIGPSIIGHCLWDKQGTSSNSYQLQTYAHNKPQTYATSLNSRSHSTVWNGKVHSMGTF